VTDLDALVGEWLPLPDVAERIGRDVGAVRRLVEDRSLLALRRGERGVLSVPAGFLVHTEDDGWQVIPALAGTLTLLGDAGFSDEAAVRWLFSPDESLRALGTGPVRPSTPVEALAAGHKTEVRRRAQAEAL
jgi:hypothetical protein